VKNLKEGREWAHPSFKNNRKFEGEIALIAPEGESGELFLQRLESFLNIFTPVLRVGSLRVGRKGKEKNLGDFT